MVLAESDGHGHPVVKTRKRGIIDSLRDRVNALFMPARDPVAVSAAIERSLVDGELCKPMRDANIEAVMASAPERVGRRESRGVPPGGQWLNQIRAE